MRTKMEMMAAGSDCNLALWACLMERCKSLPCSGRKTGDRFVPIFNARLVLQPLDSNRSAAKETTSILGFAVMYENMPLQVQVVRNVLIMTPSWAQIATHLTLSVSYEMWKFCYFALAFRNSINYA